MDVYDTIGVMLYKIGTQYVHKAGKNYQLSVSRFQLRQDILFKKRLLPAALFADGGCDACRLGAPQRICTGFA